jgi:peptidoglycan hydrolase CwlO-like protein
MGRSFALRGDRRNDEEMHELQQELRAATRQIQNASIATILKRMNQLATDFLQNNSKIEALRTQLSKIKNRI